MHKITKEEAKVFIESQGYEIILSVWDKEGNNIGDFTGKWKETLSNIINRSDEIKDKYIFFCKANNIIIEE